MATLWHHYQEGGWAMWIILFWMVCALVVTTEKVVYLFSASQDVPTFSAAINKLVLSGDWEKAIRRALSARSPLGRIVASGLRHVHEGRGAFQKGLDEQALLELPLLNKRIGYLPLFSNLAMLCGLLGTIVGLIKAFSSVAGESVDPAQKARILAEGISEAMNCTAFGLVAAVVSLTGFALTNNWAGAIEDDIHRETVQLLNSALERFTLQNAAGRRRRGGHRI